MFVIAVVFVLAGIVLIVARIRALTPSYAELDSDDALILPRTAVPIRDAREGERACISGVVSALGGPHAPRTLGGTEAVWLEVFVEVGEEDVDSRTIVRRRPVLALVDAVPFGLNDGSDEGVVVLPSGGRLSRGAAVGPLRRADEELAARLHEMLVAHNKAVDSRSPLFYAEVAIVPGDPVVVQGRLRREDPPTLYREAARARLVLQADEEGLCVWRRTS